MFEDFVEQTHHMDPYWTLAGIPLRRLELCGCRVGATGAQRLAEALRNPQGAGAAIIRKTALEIQRRTPKQPYVKGLPLLPLQHTPILVVILLNFWHVEKFRRNLTIYLASQPTRQFAGQPSNGY